MGVRIQQKVCGYQGGLLLLQGVVLPALLALSGTIGAQSVVEAPVVVSRELREQVLGLHGRHAVKILLTPPDRFSSLLTTKKIKALVDP
jgi:hypothetical protein